LATAKNCVVNRSVAMFLFAFAHFQIYTFYFTLFLLCPPDYMSVVILENTEIERPNWNV